MDNLASDNTQTHDFMNVDSFSQLPFIRPPPSKDKPIRLFGIEFATRNSPASASADDSDSADVILCDDPKESDTTAGESTRRFECHYCCRNFPTSQALGGHQNAHKRERQHAKRAHLSAAMHHGGVGIGVSGGSGGFSDSHVYGVYHRFGAAPAAPITYPSWNRNPSASAATTTRFYGSPGSYSPAAPINGSPLAMWRISAVQSSPSFGRERTVHPLPLFAGDEMKGGAVGGSGGGHQSRFVYEPKTADQVSLDLHL